MCEAVTGSGKTLSFVIPFLQKVIQIGKKEIILIILSPTRELANQTFLLIARLTKFMNRFSAVTCVGGLTKIDEDLKILENENPEIVVATPGRLQEELNIF